MGCLKAADKKHAHRRG